MTRIDRYALLFTLLGLMLLITPQALAQQTAAGQDINIDPQVAQPGGDLPGDPQIELELIADGLVDPVNVASAGDGRLFVVERIGRVRIVDEDGELLDEPFLDIQGTVLTGFLEQGLLGLAFHPNYSENGLFYVNYTDYRTNGDQWVVEYQVSDADPNVADPESARALLTFEQPYVNHNGGTIRFGPDGYLYIAVGDGGYAADTYETAQDLDNLLGTIVRIDVDTQQGALRYGIPEDNPFVPSGVELRANIDAPPQYHPNAEPEIWAYGLRNPWQFSFDTETGDAYIADVGQNMWEEINVVPSGGNEDGYNFGWDFMEASHCFPSETSDDAEGGDCLVGILPVAEYSHAEGDCSITGIGVYRGDEFSELDGIYFTSDFCSGRVWGLAQGDGGEWQFEELLDTDLLATGSGSSETGDVYLTSCECQFGRDYDPFANPAGKVWRIVAEGAAQGETAGGGAAAEGDAAEGDAGEGVAGEGDAAEEAGGEADGEEAEGEGAAAPEEQQQEQEGDQEQDQQQDQPQEQQQEPQQEQQQEDQEDAEQESAQDTQGPEGNLQALISQGDEIYHQVASPPCSACHGPNGGGGVGPALAGNDDLQDLSFVIERILEGTEIMPAYGGQLNDEQVAALAAYIRNAWENDFGAVSPEDVEAQR